LHHEDIHPISVPARPKRRPIDRSHHNELIKAEDGEFLPIPAVGDTVSYESYEYDYDSTGKAIIESGRTKIVTRKVKTRHFGYSSGADGLYINTVVGDMPQEEMAMRLEE
jgi:hypothetical protein